MRISDWSSDVCSSDLRRRAGAPAASDVVAVRAAAAAAAVRGTAAGAGIPRPRRPLPAVVVGRGRRLRGGGGVALPDLPLRSEEHTSELQSLMRISYAVFCLKKKTQ